MRNKTPFSVFRATAADIDEIEGFLYPDYFDETTYSGLDYDEALTKQQIAAWVSEDATIIIRSAGKIAALGVMQLSRTFYKQIEADIAMFVVGKKYRATGISRALIDFLLRIADENQAAVIYSSCLSGIGDKNNKMYVNLWKKYGFRELGTVMVRS